MEGKKRKYEGEEDEDKEGGAATPPGRWEAKTSSSWPSRMARRVRRGGREDDCFQDDEG